MRENWSEEKKLSLWLEIEILACEAMAERGQIPADDARAVRKNARFSIAEIGEIEKRTNHDVIAFLENVASYVGPAARWMHQGLTSSDILDTAFALQLVASADLLLADLNDLREAIAQQAQRYRRTPMIGRSHGIHAEPITFGLKMALMYDEFGRAQERIQRAREIVRIGKLSGAVGTHAHLDPEVEKIVCQRLGLRPEPLSTQVVQRDRHGEYLSQFALVASSVERWATEFRHLQRTEVREVEEFFGVGQKGSSAMPHKRNPITGERLSGLARVIRGNSIAALENIALWHERDISHSSVERIIFPDSCLLLDYMLATLTKLVAQLEVYPAHMRSNLDLTRGLYFSQTVLLELTRRGMDREDAYEAVQKAAMAAWQNQSDFLREVKQVPEITVHLSEREIEDLCSLERHFEHIDQTFRDVGLEA
jgi:adenylosuccinate lyase